ncbi:MAG: prepilin-type N-terminal cleavage/methylation domain-containing protein [Sulfurovum sp.]|nr:prepilin-type N-terminal cleavage/methylation domain-containing protein [Sulfurovum sp.]
MRKAFTLMEIMVSVVLIAIVVLGIIKLQKENIFMAKYIAGRVQSELSNTLFLGKEALKYDKDEKDAYTLLSSMRIRKDESKEILKKIKRKIYISEPLPIGEIPIPIELRAVMLKSEYSARFYRISR